MLDAKNEEYSSFLQANFADTEYNSPILPKD